MASSIILSVGIALQNGIYRCEKIEWQDNGYKPSELYWYRLNKFTGNMIISGWNFETKNFEKVIKPKREIK